MPLNTKFWRWFLLSGLICASLARSEAVGRAYLELPSQDWRLLTSFETKLTFNSGEHFLALENKVFQLPKKDDEIKALLIVTSTKGGNRRSTKWLSDTCPQSRPRFFANDFGSNNQTRVRECLVVNGAFSPRNFFKPDSEVLKAIEGSELKLFRSGYALRSVYGNQNGTLLHVNLMTDRSFVGLRESAPQAEGLHDVSPHLVAWGEQLHQAVKESVSSMAGTLVLPPIHFSGQ